MVGLPGGVEERGLDVVGLKERVVGEDFLMRGACGKEFQQVHDAEARAADAGPSATFSGFDGDAFEELHGWIVTRLEVSGKASLATPAWLPLTSFTTVDSGTQRTVTDLPATGAAKFHRVEITLP